MAQEMLLNQIKPNSQVLVLNATFEPLNITSWKRAVLLIVKGKALALSPQVVKLVEYIRVPFARVNMINPSKALIYKRDGNKCQYCGATKHLTIDHVNPRALGGGDTWSNMVVACYPCNSKKGSKTLEQAGMKLRTKPAPPMAKFMFAIKTSGNAEWHKYNFD